MDSLKRFSFLMNKHFDKLDRIPIDYWASTDVDQRLCSYFKAKNKEELLDLLDVDFRYINGPKYIGPDLAKYPDGSEDDIWGVPRKKVYYGEGENRGYYKTAVKYPLSNAQTFEDVESYDH